MSVKETVRLGLPRREGKTIPDLCKQFGIKDEFKMMHIIAELEYSGDAILDDFERIFREDGGAIYLAKYKRKSA